VNRTWRARISWYLWPVAYAVMFGDLTWQLWHGTLDWLGCVMFTIYGFLASVVAMREAVRRGDEIAEGRNV
jgi:hypothetical protein